MMNTASIKLSIKESCACSINTSGVCILSHTMSVYLVWIREGVYTLQAFAVISLKATAKWSTNKWLYFYWRQTLEQIKRSIYRKVVQFIQIKQKCLSVCLSVTLSHVMMSLMTLLTFFTWWRHKRPVHHVTTSLTSLDPSNAGSPSCLAYIWNSARIIVRLQPRKTKNAFQWNATAMNFIESHCNGTITRKWFIVLRQKSICILLYWNIRYNDMIPRKQCRPTWIVLCVGCSISMYFYFWMRLVTKETSCFDVSRLLYFWFKYDLGQNTTHPKLDPTLVRTHDLHDGTFHVTETPALITQPSVTAILYELTISLDQYLIAWVCKCIY